MSSMPHHPSQRGVSLIEVLVALLIFSIGLIGAASLLVMSARSSHTAFLRTQVTFLAQSMADRMQANPMGVWLGAYNGAYPEQASQDCAAGCTPRQLAVYDRGAWSRQLSTFLSADVQASIDCSNDGLAHAPTPDQWALRPPYGGNCRMRMSWAEQGTGASGTDQNDRAQQTFAWEFQP
jgi:type IV pilus assembly protein PilV